jgi:hypothetical protein
MVIFTLVNVETAVGGGRAAPIRTTVKSARNGAKGGRRGKNANRVAWLQWPVMATLRKKSMTLMRSSW